MRILKSLNGHINNLIFKKMKSLILLSASLISLGAFAQKTDKVNIDYEMEMYPVELISKEKKFDIIVDYEYRSKTEASAAETAEKKEQAAKDKEIGRASCRERV